MHDWASDLLEVEGFSIIYIFAWHRLLVSDVWVVVTFGGVIHPTGNQPVLTVKCISHLVQELSCYGDMVNVRRERFISERKLERFVPGGGGRRCSNLFLELVSAALLRHLVNSA